MGGLVGGLLFAFALAAQTPDADTGLSPSALMLARIKLHMSDNLKRQPNYTCLETVERTRRPKGGRAQAVDTVRLEVALVNGKEMFAWPGAKKFEDREIRELVATGLFGNGNFAVFARAVFMGGSHVFVPREREMLGGKTAIRYDFRVDKENSGYTMRVGGREAVVGYHGSFWADPETLDVRRLEIIADDIPSYLGADSAYDRMDYARLPIGGEEFLLPSESVLEMGTRDADSRNFIRFTACRQYTGESVLKFTEELTPGVDPLALPSIREVELAKGTGLTLGLTADLDLRDMAVGDAITANLQSDVKVKRQVVVPKRAVARGRITRLERNPGYTVVGISFTDLDWEDRHAVVHGELERTLGNPPSGADMRRWPIYKASDGEGIVMLPTSQTRLIRGMLFYWRTD